MMMEAQFNHPNDAALCALSLGQLTEAELVHVSTHLSDCPTCCRRIDELATDDRLLARLRQSTTSQEEVLVSPVQRRAAVRALRHAREDRSSIRLTTGTDTPMVPRSSLGGRRPVQLRKVKGESDSVGRPGSDAMPQQSETGGRYELFGEIARGGMGAVLRARDLDLGRNLAVKVLLERHANLPEVARRFVEEAQIGGQLQHPGVVPVYDIGRFGDRPFFTMKLVEGLTLAAILGERARPTDERPRLLNIALKVTEALAYAHAKGVIHRDLKPANIMVGAFGEVQVMDWGLAKVLDTETRGHAGTETENSSLSLSPELHDSSTGNRTETGSVLGTPAYMPPEQANGAIDRLDRRADVFGLGAILCEILTGKPPYVGRTNEEVHLKAASADLADAHYRLDSCGADPALIVLTKRCLAPDAIDRPSDAQGVADGLSAYLNGVQERLQATERERAVALVRVSEEGKRRKVQLALTLTVVGLLLGCGAFAFWYNEQAQIGRERDARNAEAVAALLGQCEEALRADDAAKATVALEAAKKRYAEGGAQEQAERLRRLDADVALMRDLDVVDQFRWTWVENRFPDPAVVATRTRAALRRFGTVPDVISVEEAAARVSASVARARVVAALDRLLLQEKSAVVRALLRRVDADLYRDAIRDAVLALDEAKVVELAGQKAALEQPPGFVAFLGEYGDIPVERRRQLLLAAVSQRPEDLCLLMTLGLTYPTNEKESANERLRWFQAAVAAVPANAAAHNGLGIALLDKGQVEGAIARFQKAIAIHPKVAVYHDNLGIALRAQGQVEAAIARFEQAIALDPNYARAHNSLGAVLCDVKRDFDGAIARFEQAIVLDPNFAWAHANLGNARASKGQLDQAITCWQQAIALDPKLVQAHANLGIALTEKGQVDEATACFKKVIAIHPNDSRARALLAKVERLAAIRVKFTAYQNGTYTPDTSSERLDLVEWCQVKELYHTAARLYGTAIDADTRLADNLKTGHRYRAACHAALAAAGQGEDAANLDDKECTHLRQQSLAWLRADLNLWAKRLQSGQPADLVAVQQALKHWQQDTCLASFHDAAALAKLTSEEQKAWSQLWADVAALLKKAESISPKG